MLGHDWTQLDTTRYDWTAVTTGHNWTRLDMTGHDADATLTAEI